MKQYIFSLTTLGAVLFLRAAPAAASAEPSVERLNCYRVEFADSPINAPNVGFFAGPSDVAQWCYAHAQFEDRDVVLVFNNDEAVLRPELSALVQLSDDGQVVTVAHGSRVGGQLTIVRSVRPAFSPLSVPLLEKDLASERGLSSTPVVGVALPANFNAMFGALSGRTAFVRDVARRRVAAGHLESMLPDTMFPWVGYLWNYAYYELDTGIYSPLGKYDQLEQLATGVNPGTVDWELANHSPAAVAWGGHCNGWVASSLLYPEPTKNLWSPEARLVLTPTDAKGLLQEASFCVDMAFYGHRSYGRPTDDPLDIYPDKFHQVLLYYIDQLKKPFAMDYMPDLNIDNNIVTGYSIDIAADASSPKVFNVTANLRMHRYEGYLGPMGAAPNYTRTFTYNLEVDDQGNIVKGTWTSENPDFLWVPLAQKKCGHENQNLDADRVSYYLANLPEAQPVETAVDKVIKAGMLAPGESVELLTEFRGYNPTVTFTGAQALDGLTLEAKLYVDHPSNNNDGTDVLQQLISATASDFEFNIGGNEIVSLKVTNGTATPRDVTGALLHSVKFFGGQ